MIDFPKLEKLDIHEIESSMSSDNMKGVEFFFDHLGLRASICTRMHRPARVRVSESTSIQSSPNSGPGSGETVAKPLNHSGVRTEAANGILSEIETDRPCSSQASDNGTAPRRCLNGESRCHKDRILTQMPTTLERATVPDISRRHS